MDKKYVFIMDFDDTLAIHDSMAVNPEIIKEIIRLKKLGHKFVICTGRSVDTTTHIKGAEVFDYISPLSGNIIIVPATNEIVFKYQFMDIYHTADLVRELNQHNIKWSYKDDHIEKTLVNEKWFYELYLAKVVPEQEFMDDLANNNVSQILVHGSVPKGMPEDFTMFGFFEMPKGYCDITPTGVNKKLSVDFCRQQFPNHTIVAIGDSNNDLSMLTTSDISVAMGNASPNVQSQATFVTLPCTELGVIHAFKKVIGEIE